jgi:SIR2-like domain
MTSSVTTVPVRGRGQDARVELEADAALLEPHAARWRTTVAAELGCARVVFAARERQLVLEYGEARPPSPAEAAADPTAFPDDLGHVYTPAGLVELIDRENHISFDLLVQQIRSPMGIVPFVGAGMSVEFGFPSWSKFLVDAAPLHPAPEAVLSKLAAGDPVGAATVLFEESPERFQRLVVSYFGREVGPDETRGRPVGLLPMIASGPVITTNFDCVLEAAFGASGSPFVRVVTGQEPDHVIRAMHRNERVLIKLHGNATDRSARVFTGLEYDKQYGNEGISKLARIMFTNRPLLFVGSSLDEDRTLDVLRALHEELPGLCHYGVLAVPVGVAEATRRRRQLDRLGISPLWFLPGEFERVYELLQELLQEASTHLLWRSSGPRALLAAKAPTAPEGPPEPRREPPALGDELELVTQRIARRLVHGRLTFFLGSGVHLGKSMTARTFYRSLAKDYGFQEADGQRAEVAQFIVDLESKAEAWSVARQKLQATTGRPSEVIQFLAELPTLLARGGSGVHPRLWLLTTNYDTLLEEALAARGEPFHLLYYQSDGEWEGRFVYRDLDGTIRVLERPQNIHTLGEAGHVVVKLDGGIPWDERIPESVTFAPLEFSISAGRLPAAFPRVLQQVVREQSLLVLGSSLQDPHVQRIVRWSAGARHAVKTWAVRNDVTPTLERYWSATGVQLLNCDLGEFAAVLRTQLLGLLGVPGA